MDNFNGYPATYQPAVYYYQPSVTTAQPTYYRQPNWNTTQQQQIQVPQQAPQQQQNNTAMVWVQGEAGAKAFSLPPNTTVPLWDSEAQVIYIKSVDANGKPTMTILDYVDRNAPVEKENVQSVEYATKEQIDSLSDKFQAFSEKFNNMTSYATEEQLKSLSGHMNELSNHVEEIENRIMSFGKPQQNQNSNGRRGNK